MIRHERAFRQTGETCIEYFFDRRVGSSNGGSDVGKHRACFGLLVFGNHGASVFNAVFAFGNQYYDRTHAFIAYTAPVPPEGVQK